MLTAVPELIRCADASALTASIVTCGCLVPITVTSYVLAEVWVVPAIVARMVEDRAESVVVHKLCHHGPCGGDCRIVARSWRFPARLQTRCYEHSENCFFGATLFHKALISVHSLGDMRGRTLLA